MKFQKNDITYFSSLDNTTQKAALYLLTYTRSLPKFQKSKTKKKCKITCVVIQAGPYWSKIHARLNEMTSVFGNKK